MCGQKNKLVWKLWVCFQYPNELTLLNANDLNVGRIEEIVFAGNVLFTIYLHTTWHVAEKSWQQ